MVLQMIINLVIFLVSLGVLSYCAKRVIDKTLRLTYFFRISEIAAGFILVSIVTSLPELSIAVISFSGGRGALSIGDILGSNVVNIAVTLGVCGYIGLKKLKDETINSALVFILILLMAHTFILDGYIGYSDSLLLLFLFGVFVYYAISVEVPLNNKSKKTISKKEALKDFIFFLAFSAIVIISAGFVVSSAIELAKAFNIYQTFLGATLIAIGTSLPELAVNIAAIKKGKGKIAIGAIIGSCLFNMTFILGIGVLISPLALNMEMVWPIAVFSIFSAIVLAFFLSRDKTVTKKVAVLLLLIYLIYLIWISGIQITQII